MQTAGNGAWSPATLAASTATGAMVSAAAANGYTPDRRGHAAMLTGSPGSKVPSGVRHRRLSLTQQNNRVRFVSRRTLRVA